MQAQLVIEHLMQLGDPIRAQTNLRFFKTAEGEYGAGDHFLGITMPKLRAAVKEHRGLPHSLLLELVRSQWH